MQWTRPSNNPIELKDTPEMERFAIRQGWLKPSWLKPKKTTKKAAPKKAQ